MKPKKLIVFDKDGTLIDIHHYWGRMIAMRALLLSDRFATLPEKVSISTRLMDAMGVDVSTGFLKPEGPVGIKPREFIVSVVTEVLAEANLAVTRDDVVEVFALVDEYSRANLASFINVLPGVKTLLTQLNDQDYLLAVATTDLGERARLGLNAGNIGHFFDSIVGGDQVNKVKPAPDMLIKLMQKYAVSPGETLMIGDAKVDQKMALAAGVDFIGVMTGLIDDAVSSSKEDFWYVDMLEVEKMLCR